MERTAKALEAWREANRELDFAAQKLMEDPASEDLQLVFRRAAARERAARQDYHAHIERIRIRQLNPAD